MLEERNLKLDLVALGLLALTVFLAASLLSYDRADPPSVLVYPTRAETANICGHSGAIVSALLFNALGLGAYYLLFSLAVLDSLLLARRPVSDPLLRLIGWLLSLVGLSTLAAMLLPGPSPGPVIGSGGYLGAVGRGLLEMYFASVGAYILVVSLILGGLLLWTDYMLVRFLAWTVVLPVEHFARGILRLRTARGNRPNRLKRRSTDADSDLASDGEYEDVSVRIGGRAADEEAEEEEADSKQAAANEPPASPVRVRKPKKTRREKLVEEIEATSSDEGTADYELPSVDLLLAGEPFCFDEHEKEVRRKARVLEKTFADFGFNIRVVEIQTGPVIAQFEVALEAGLRLSRITGLAGDLAIALKVPSVRIVAPIPGKNTVGIEVPNVERQLVRLREVIEESNGQDLTMRIPIYLGKDVSGNPMVVDLASLPHLLIAGRTGTGKSVCLNTIIASILMTRRPDETRLLLIDPKMVELSPYKQIPHLMHPVVTDMCKAEAILAWAVEKMEERYRLLAQAGVRHLSVYNQLGREELRERIQPEDDQQWAQIPKRMPYIVIVADEMADLMMTAAKEVEGHIIRLAQKSRAVGIHLVMATQKPTVDVITGLIKSNLPARICFEVSSRTDSRVVLDEMGADKLLGDGDMLFLRPGTSALIRGQGTYLGDDEIGKLIGAVATSQPQFVKELIQLKAVGGGGDGPQLENRDELYEAAVDIVVREGRGSVSLLQRSLGIGYGRAARLIDYMAADGIVGPYNGSQAREILISVGQWEEMRGRPMAERLAPQPHQSNKILLAASDDEDPPFEVDEEADVDEEDEYDEEGSDEEYDHDEYEEDDEFEQEDAEDDEEYDDEVDEEDDEDTWAAETA